MKAILLGNLTRRATLPGVLPAMRASLIWLIILSVAQAVNPPPGGAYPGQNTAAGTNALLRLTDGTGNTALGSGALENNTDGQSNTAAGTGALDGNRRGNQNTGIGILALESSRFDNGPDNTAYGYRALGDNNGSRNTAIGWNALKNVFEGIENIALGHSAGRNLSSSGSYNIEIGNIGAAGDNRVVRIGDTDQVRTFVAGVSGTTVTNGLAVRVNAAGQLGTAPSSERFKDGIKPMRKESEAIFALKPVTFRYKREIDPHDNRARITSQIFLEPLQRFEIEMIRRFARMIQPPLKARAGRSKSVSRKASPARTRFAFGSSSHAPCSSKTWSAL